MVLAVGQFMEESLGKEERIPFTMRSLALKGTRLNFKLQGQV